MAVNDSHDDTDVADRWDRVFRTLFQEPRRELLISLLDRPAAERVSLPDAALSPHFSGSREDLRISLHHQHLPVLADHGYVVWDDSPFEARQGPNFEEVEAVLRAITESGDALPDQLVTGCRTMERQIGSK